MKARYCVFATIAFLAMASPAIPQTLADIDILELAKAGSLRDIQAAIALGADVNTQDAGGQTALMYAAENDQPPEVIIELLRAGAAVNMRDSSGVTPLMYAAGYNRHVEAVTLLLAAGADAYARDNAFTTPLMYAIENEQPREIIATLREASANVTNRY